MESPRTPILVQESEVKELLMESKLKFKSTLNCTASSVANNPNQPTASKSLENLVSELSEATLLGLVRLAGKPINQDDLGKTKSVFRPRWVLSFGVRMST